jgi:hypothetical protein
MMRLQCGLVALLVCSALSIGCDKKEAPPPASEPPTAPPAPVAATPAPAAADPVVDASTLPVEEQYEADAEKEISTANLEQKLDELEKELAAP